jgi:hypothetical protein
LRDADPGRTGCRLAAALLTVAVGLGALVATSTAHPAPAVSLAAAPFPDGPPARVTGGFGEDTCADCHFNYDEAAPPGTLNVAGFPACYREGERYELIVTLQDPDMAAAGFQLAVRFARDASHAGILATPDEEAGRVAVLTDREIMFAQHTLDGSTLTEPGAASWSVHWTAPAGRGRVLLHVAGLAGDGDQSQEGDRTYSVEGASGGKSC